MEGVVLIEGGGGRLYAPALASGVVSLGAWVCFWLVLVCGERVWVRGGLTLDVFSAALLYVGCVVGAVGVALAAPKRGTSAGVVGSLLAAGGVGLMFLGVSVAGAAHVPNFNFYLFGLIAVASSVRVVTHPRPVYAALYFVLTILSVAGLFVLLGAEFMAFALVIVYAGAILITYLFVIMLATQAPSEEELDALASYDRYSREPVVAAGTGFVLIALLSTLLVAGAAGLRDPGVYGGDRYVGRLPGKVATVLRDGGVIDADERVTAVELDGMGGGVIATSYGSVDRVIDVSELPAGVADRLRLVNTEAVGFELLAAKPGMIEIAGVVLLMAMLGAVVLSRKKVEIDERVRAAFAGGAGGGGGVDGRAA